MSAEKPLSPLAWTCAKCGLAQEPLDGFCVSCGAQHPDLETIGSLPRTSGEILSSAAALRPLEGRARLELALEVLIVVLVGWASSWFFSFGVHFWPEMGQFWPEMGGRACPFWLYYSSQVVWDIPLILLILYLHWRSGEPWSSCGIRSPMFVRDVVIAGGALFANFMFLLLMSYFLYPVLERLVAWPPEGKLPDVLPTPSGVLEWTFASTVISISALFEELSMRGYLIPRLERLLRSPGEAVLLSTVVFAGAHAYQGFYGVLDAARFGIIFGIVFVLTGRLWPLVLAHAAHNIYIVASR